MLYGVNGSSNSALQTLFDVSNDFKHRVLSSLSLPDLGRLAQTSTFFTDQTSSEIEKRAQRLFENEQGDSVNRSVLQDVVAGVDIHRANVNRPFTTYLRLHHCVGERDVHAIVPCSTKNIVLPSDAMDIGFDTAGSPIFERFVAGSGVFAYESPSGGPSSHVAIPAGWSPLEARTPFAIPMTKTSLTPSDRSVPIVNEATRQLALYTPSKPLDAINLPPDRIAVSSGSGALAAYSPNGEWLVYYHRQFPGCTYLFDLKSHDFRRVCWASENLTSISVSNSGRVYLADHILHLEFDEENYPATLRDAPMNSPYQLSPDGKFLIEGCDGTVDKNLTLHDLTSQRKKALVRTAPTNNPGYLRHPIAMAFDPLNRYVAIAYADCGAKVFDLERGEANAASIGHLTFTSTHDMSASFSPIAFDKRPDVIHLVQKCSPNEATMHTFSLR